MQRELSIYRLTIANLLLAIGLLYIGATISLFAAEKPNIVFILADDLGYVDLSSYGATKVETPNIDRLAKEGRKFTDVHSPHSVCTPSRYSLMTGHYSWRTWAKTANVWSTDPMLIDDDQYTLPKMLNDSGYQNALVGKWAVESELTRKKYWGLLILTSNWKR